MGEIDSDKCGKDLATKKSFRKAKENGNETGDIATALTWYLMRF